MYGGRCERASPERRTGLDSRLRGDDGGTARPPFDRLRVTSCFLEQALRVTSCSLEQALRATSRGRYARPDWIPACAGMTEGRRCASPAPFSILWRRAGDEVSSQDRMPWQYSSPTLRQAQGDGLFSGTGAQSNEPGKLRPAGLGPRLRGDDGERKEGRGSGPSAIIRPTRPGKTPG